MLNLLLQELRKPYGPLIPWTGVVLLLLLALWGVNSLGLEVTEQTQSTLEAEWIQARKSFQQHQEARRVKRDLAQVWSVLPAEQDFAALALGITEEAKRNRLHLPDLSYKTERASPGNGVKGVLQGTISGRYEDLRRFLYDIETAEELLFIEHLDLVPSSTKNDPMLTFNVKIATFLRGEKTSQSPHNL
ncbi:type 4a pilus biogenesis protein PilO [Petrachloros mirabilis]